MRSGVSLNDLHDPTDNMGFVAPIPITFSGDLSTTCYGQWLKRPAWATSACLGIGWPATGTPVGVLTIEGSDSPEAITGVTIATLTTTPAGTAAGTIVDIGPIACAYIRPKYVPTSGGAGATFRRADQTAGTVPSITWGP